MTDRDALIHLTAGGIGGTFGAIATCPLEVIKVRLQSSEGADLNGKNGNGGLVQRAGTASSQSNAFRRAAPKEPHSNFQPQTLMYSNVADSRSIHTHSASKLHQCLPSTSKMQESIRSISANPLTQKPSNFRNSPYPALIRQLQTQGGTKTLGVGALDFTVWKLLRGVVKKEGFGALFKGVGPNVIGVAPSKAIYFYAYSSSKRFLNEVSPPNTPWIHMISAGSAGFLTASCVNPIWLIKTRLQLDRESGKKRLTILQCAKRIYKVGGVRGFWKGVTASYVGIFETIVQFVLYEYLRASFVGNNDDIRQNRDTSDFLHFMLCGGVSKLVATSLWYPHEVCRTRLREEGTKYTGFYQTLRTVFREEGKRGLYRGLSVHLLRTIPNTAITMGTYEVAVYLLANLASS